jgi:hypothetical protein
MRSGLVLLLLSVPASAAPTRRLGGEQVPVVDAEPAFDQGTYIAPASSRLASTYRTQLTTQTLDKTERESLKRDALPPGQFLVRIHRDKRGQRYLYKPCDFGYHERVLITGTEIILLANEPLAVPIARKETKGRITTIELHDANLPPMVSTKFRLRTTTIPGQFELAAGDDDFSELVATPAAVAKLDVVVRVCKTAKTPELDFAASPGRAPR